MGGEFHLSLGCEFEDVNDCKPYFNKKDVANGIETFLNRLSMEITMKRAILLQVESDITQDYLDKIISNYQRYISIGCFTDLECNEKMWDKYADGKRGCCIEYDTSKCELFTSSMLPITYTNKPYNASGTLVNYLILECNREAKHRTLDKDIDIFQYEYEKLVRTACIPIFTKQKYWEFEREYRLFYLSNRPKRGIPKKREFCFDENRNINLSDSISSIYLGEYFDENRNSKKILDDIKMIACSNNISLYRKVNVNGEIRNEEIV